jgi:uncharacterized protein DUF6933
MAQIMCTQKLWQRLGQGDRASIEHAIQPMPGVSLGPWAAKVFKEAGREYVLALEKRTYLTLVFPGAPFSQFRRGFSTALANALSDFGVGQLTVRTECAAIDFEPLVRLADEVLLDRLDDIEFTCGIEFCYHEDLRIVQRNPNELPHPNRDPCVPAQAVRRLFEGGGVGGEFALQ